MLLQIYFLKASNQWIVLIGLLHTDADVIAAV